MKRTILTAVLAIAFVLGFNACQNNGTVNAPLADNSSSAGYLLQSPVAVNSDINEATLSNSMVLIPGEIAYPEHSYFPTYMGGPLDGNDKKMDSARKDTNRKDPRDPKGKGPDGKGPGKDFRWNPFAKLFGDLTEEQKTVITDITKSYRDCVKAAMDALRATEKPIIDAANAQRKVILENLKSGAIDKAAARQQLQDLNKATRDALNANPAKAAAQTAMCDCWKVYSEGISSALTGDALARWTEFLAKFKSPCDKTTNPVK